MLSSANLSPYECFYMGNILFVYLPFPMTQTTDVHVLPHGVAAG